MLSFILGLVIGSTFGLLTMAIIIGGNDGEDDDYDSSY